MRERLRSNPSSGCVDSTGLAVEACNADATDARRGSERVHRDLLAAAFAWRKIKRSGRHRAVRLLDKSWGGLALRGRRGRGTRGEAGEETSRLGMEPVASDVLQLCRLSNRRSAQPSALGRSDPRESDNTLHSAPELEPFSSAFQEMFPWPEAEGLSRTTRR